MTRYLSVNNDKAPALFALSLVTLLVACGDGSGPMDAALDAQTSAGADAFVSPDLGAAQLELGTPPTEIRPSISAAQLLNDNTQTVSFAQSTVNSVSVAAPDVGAALPDSGTAVDVNQIAAVSTPSAPAPILPPVEVTPAPVATPAPAPAPAPAPVPVPVTDTVAAAAPAIAPVAPVMAPEPTTTPAVTPIAITEPAPASTPAVDAALENIEEPVAVIETAPTSEPAPAETQTAETSAVEPAIGAANPADTETGDIQTRFTGSNTPTFVGVLNDDQTVQLDWEVDPTARGYNVYRDAEYIMTVFENTYLDEFDAFDQNYYYEIQAFDFEENYSTIATGLTVAVTGTGRTDPNAPQVDETLLDNYELVFSDEFNGTTLDTSKWNTAYLWGDQLIINSELQHYVDIANDPDFGFNPFSFDGESLTINTIRTPLNLLETANGQEYLSGVITSYDAFKFTYGYVEANAQVPVGKGYWPAFWLLNAYYDMDKPEIDIMEFIGDNQDTAYHTYHYYDAEGNLRSTKSEPTFPIDFSANFHRFGVEWEPGKVTFYVDGIARHTISDPKISQEEMYIIANTAVGGWWPGDPDETTVFPGEYKIDYIRAYQRVGVQQDAPQFENPESLVPVRNDGSQSSPSHLPPFELWPNGYPER